MTRYVIERVIGEKSSVEIELFDSIRGGVGSDGDGGAAAWPRQAYLPESRQGSKLVFGRLRAGVAFNQETHRVFKIVFRPQAGHKRADDTYIRIMLALKAAADSGDTGGPDGKGPLTTLQAKWRELAAELAGLEAKFHVQVLHEAKKGVSPPDSRFV